MYISDRIVTNSYAEADRLREYYFLEKKVRTIWNGMDIHSSRFKHKEDRRKTLNLLVVGRVAHPKNGVNLMKALLIFHDRNGWIPKINWVGRMDSGKRSLKMQLKMNELLINNPQLQQSWEWKGLVENVDEYFKSSDILLQVSIYEGLPMVICEAMLHECFVIASNVSDNPKILGNQRGLLCDPESPESICSVIEEFFKISDEKKREFIKNARNYAIQEFNEQLMVSRYEDLFTEFKGPNNVRNK